MPNSKAEFITLNGLGRFGNRLRQWERMAEIQLSGYNGLVGVRGRKPGMKTFVSHLPVSALEDAMKLIIRDHPQYTSSDFYFTESAPDDFLILQGEFGHIGSTGRYLRYNNQRGLNMRQAMADGYTDVEGIAALVLLHTHMTPYSWEDFNILREAYPDCIIEFGVYGCRLGSLPQRNTIIWEVRAY